MEIKKNIGGWFEIYVEDMKRAKDFYQHVFQVEKFIDLSNADAGFEMLAFEWDDNGIGAGGALVRMDFNQPSKTGTIIYFNCDDCAEEESRAKEKGVEIVVPKRSLGEFGFASIIRDSEGNLIGLYSFN